MRARRFRGADQVIRLEGGTEDNDLWARVDRLSDGTPMITSVWVPTDEERLAIAAGANIELIVLAVRTPPIAMAVTDIPLGK